MCLGSARRSVASCSSWSAIPCTTPRWSPPVVGRAGCRWPTITASPRRRCVIALRCADVMPFIRVVQDDEATGDCARELDAARRRAGRVWNIVRAMTPNPAVLRASMQLYQAVMYGESPLSRRQRELLAVVVSRRNGCVY
ncbi:MAG TPA: hypothetical protein ENI87_10900 [bacterium]|nr:hypothetical protein [bacterium]